MTDTIGEYLATLCAENKLTNISISIHLDCSARARFSAFVHWHQRGEKHCAHGEGPHTEMALKNALVDMKGQKDALDARPINVLSKSAMAALEEAAERVKALADEPAPSRGVQRSTILRRAAEEILAPLRNGQ